MTPDERLRRQLTGLGLRGWDLEHLVICDECVVGWDYEDIDILRCEVAAGHAEMEYDLDRRGWPPVNPSRSGVSLADADRLIREMYVPLMREMFARETLLLRTLS